MIDVLDLAADVLVAGGGPAGAWAALKAADADADVVMVDKGFCGTSGATASAGTGVWYVPPDPASREAAMASREDLNGHLSDRRWMARVLDQTWENVNELAQRGRYPFPVGPDGRKVRRGVQGPEYVRRMRIMLKRAGLRILDRSSALELLIDGAGTVAGAAGYRRQHDQSYRVRADAVVLATGGCAFLSRALGCDVNTGDGALFAAEVGAELSGMEFSNAYAIALEFSSVTKTAYYSYATFFNEDGTVLEGAGSQRRRSVIARALCVRVPPSPRPAGRPPRRHPSPYTPNAGTAAAPARSNAPATTATRSRNPARPPAPATPDQRPSASGPCRPHRQPTPGRTPRRVQTHRALPGTTRTSTKEQNRCPAVTLDHRPNVTNPARHPPAHHTAPADATAPPDTPQTSSPTP
jgi:glycine/D-amino acid oxidase-like deaminating enzyme